MLLSNQQKYIISVLRQIKYIRSCQLCALTAQHYRPQGIEISQHRMDVMLRQLRAGTNFVRLQEDIVCYGKRAVDPRYLEAIDVMLELSGCDPSFLSSERLESPFLLRFTGSGEELSYLFTVAWMDTSERILATSRMKGERIILHAFLKLVCEKRIKTRLFAGSIGRCIGRRTSLPGSGVGFGGGS